MNMMMYSFLKKCFQKCTKNLQYVYNNGTGMWKKITQITELFMIGRVFK